jgi:hypothetical protein
LPQARANKAKVPAASKPPTNGCLRATNARVAGSAAARADIGVSVRPGAITLTRMPDGA